MLGINHGINHRIKNAKFKLKVNNMLTQYEFYIQSWESA